MTGTGTLNNAEIADRLASLAQLMAAGKETPADLTAFPGIGEGIAACIREIVTTGTHGKLEKLRASASPELTDLSRFPRLDPKRVLRVYKKLGISSVEA